MWVLSRNRNAQTLEGLKQRINRTFFRLVEECLLQLPDPARSLRSGLTLPAACVAVAQLTV